MMLLLTLAWRACGGKKNRQRLAWGMFTTLGAYLGRAAVLCQPSALVMPLLTALTRPSEPSVAGGLSISVSEMHVAVAAAVILLTASAGGRDEPGRETRDACCRALVGAAVPTYPCCSAPPGAESAS